MTGSRLETHIKFHIKLILEKVVHIPALAKPPGTVFRGFQPKPVIVRLFVLTHVLDTEIAMETCPSK